MLNEVFMKNPFTLKVVSDKVYFCNRTSEIKDLMRYAQNEANVVLYSPRRYGKTSLVHQVQARLRANGFLTVFVDLFGLSSVDNIADRIARGIYAGLLSHKPLMNRAVDMIKTYKPSLSLSENSAFNLSVEKSSQRLFGEDLLDATLKEVGAFLKKTGRAVNIVFDEFQEIVELKNPNIEGILRSHIQSHPVSYVFVGSRRRVLLEMFNLKRRAFFQSAFDYELGVLPHDELVPFIGKRFEAGKKKCSATMAGRIADRVSDHPFYTQKLCYFVYEETAKTATEKNIEAAFDDLMQNETFYFEKSLQILAPQQIAVLKAVSREPTASILSTSYMQKHNLKSVGGVQGALKRLQLLDYIDKDQGKTWYVVDPIFAIWLNQT